MSTGNNPLLPKLSPITIKERVSLVFVEKGNLDVLDGAFVVVDVNGVRTHIPVGGVSCLMLEPGTRISHAAAALAARVGCLICWVGEADVRTWPACASSCDDVPHTRGDEPTFSENKIGFW